MLITIFHGKIDKPLLNKIICAVIEDNIDNEELKPEIYNAINNQS